MMPDMTLTDILQDIHALATELQAYEHKYGVLKCDRYYQWRLYRERS
jgi:hypothetical protein